MRTVLLMQCLTEINDMGDQRRVPVSDKCLREVGRVSESDPSKIRNQCLICDDKEIIVTC